jgi:hypothetical protein
MQKRKTLRSDKKSNFAMPAHTGTTLGLGSHDGDEIFGLS